jgi:hypothetical protein
MDKQCYFGDFNSWSDIMTEFCVKPELEEPKFVFAFYDIDSYGGHASVVYSYDGINFYIIEAFHCSCYGFENQWDEDGEYTLKEIIKMKNIFSKYSDEYEDWLKLFQLQN